ncbi:MAG: hypothetical protein M3444_15715 [Acidobacteriota bacterium]|nr:hypothetical protein [Acidobacteriota bacterium]MDQ5835775.1 hypothetical protein [Acidobacteriota bacterium]
MSAIQNLAKRPVIVVTLASAFIASAVYSVALFFDLARAANVATIMLSIIVGISVFFIWGQLRQQARLTRVANTQALVGLSSPFNMQLIQDRQTAELWVTGPRDYERMDEVDRYRYRMLLYWWLIFHENVFYQKQNDLLDEHIFASWAYDLEHFVAQQNLQAHWGDLRAGFQPEFARHIDELIEPHKSGRRAPDAPRLQSVAGKRRA